MNDQISHTHEIYVYEMFSYASFPLSSVVKLLV